MFYALLALTTAQIAIVAVCAAVGVVLITVGAVGIARSAKKKNSAPPPPSVGTASKQPSEPQPSPAEPVEEPPAQAAEAAEPVQEEPSQAQEEVPAAPVEEAPAQAAEAAEPVEEAPAQAQENAEPDEESPAQAQEAAEPVEEAPAQAQEAAEPVEEPPAQAAEAAEPAAEKTRVVYTDSDGWYVNIRYDKSFEAKLIQGDAQLKSYYSALKNELLSYKKVSVRRSWQHEAFRRGRTTVAKLAIRGKTLRLYLALEPALYDETKYRVEDASEHAKFAKTPLLYRIKNDRRCRYAKDLIAAAMDAAEAEQGEAEDRAYGDLPFESTEALIGRGLVRVIEVRRRAQGAGAVVLPDEEEYEEDDEPVAAPAPVALAPRPVTALTVKEEHRVSVAAAEELMADEEAEELVVAAERESDRRCQTIVNIDTLSEYFEDGERVGIEEMKERIPFFNKKATYVKVLARGVLTKTLEVEADDFSLDAVKMIALLGGKVFRAKK